MVKAATNVRSVKQQMLQTWC